MWRVGLVLVLLALVVWWYLRGTRKVAIVSLVTEPHQFQTWIDHHKTKMGINRFYIFQDSEEDLGPVDPSVILIKNWKDRLGYNFDPEMDQPANVRVRQQLAFDEGHRMAQRDGMDYIVHIDCDELLYGDRPASVFDRYPRSGAFHLVNEELAPDRMDYKNCFVEGKKFHADPSRFTAYGNGKAAGRVGQCEWHGPHFLKGRDPVNVPRDQLRVLHYPSCNLDETLKRAKRYGEFKSDSAGWSKHHIETRDALVGCGADCEERARDVFSKRMVSATSPIKVIEV